MNTNELLMKISLTHNVADDFYRNKMKIADDIMSNSRGREVVLNPQTTLDWVCNSLSLNKEHTLKTRELDSVIAKSISSVLLYKQHGWCTKKIATIMGCKSHASVLNYFVNMDVGRARYNRKLSKAWTKIKRELNIPWEFVYETNRKRDLA